MEPRTLNARVRAHLGDGDAPHVIQRAFPEYVSGDIAIAMKEFLSELGADVFRFSGDPVGLLDGDAAPVRLTASPVLQQIDVPDGGSRQGIGEGLACLCFEGTPMLVYCCRQRDRPSKVSAYAQPV